MKQILILSIIIFSFAASACGKTTINTDDPVNVYDIKVKTMNGEDKPLSDYKGKILLIVKLSRTTPGLKLPSARRKTAVPFSLRKKRNLPAPARKI